MLCDTVVVFMDSPPKHFIRIHLTHFPLASATFRVFQGATKDDASKGNELNEL